jgi:hypothetical protein
MNFSFAKSSTADVKPTYVPNADGTISMIPPERPEPVRRTPQYMSEALVRNYLGLSPDEFEAVVQGRDFPPCLRRGRERGWFDTTVEAWVESTRRDAAAKTALVAKVKPRW